MPRPSSHRARVPLTGRLRRVPVRALLAAGAVGVLGATGTTFAAWTDSATVTGTSLTTGTVDLTVQGQDAVTTWTDLGTTAMVPGGSVAGVLTVRNAGTAPLKWTAATTATNPDGKGLATALAVKVTGAATVTGTAPGATCGGATLAGAGSTLGGTLVGTGRLLAAGASETLCVQLSLPGTAASGLQGATTGVTVALTATSDLA